MRASRFVLGLAMLAAGIGAAWLIVQFCKSSSAPLETARHSSSATPSNPAAPPLPDPVSAERSKLSLEPRDDAAKGDSKESADAAPAKDPNEKLRTYFVRLTDESDGSPIADARCIVGPYDFGLFQTTSLEWKGGPRVRTHSGSLSFEEVARTTAVSEADGVASFEVPRERTLVVAATADGFLPAWFVANTSASGLAPARDDHATRERALEIGMARSAALAGVVLRDGKGPFAEAEIRLAFGNEELRRPRSNFGTTFSQRSEARATADASGRFEFEGLPADVALHLSVTDAAAIANERELWLDPGERREIEWLVGGRARLSGRVVGSDGGAIAGALIELSVGSQENLGYPVTNEKGEFEFDDLLAGDLHLRVDSLDGRHASADLMLTLAPGEHRDGLLIELPAAAPLTVRAVGRKGDPLNSIQVQVWSLVDRRTRVDSSRGESEAERARVLLPGIPIGGAVVRVDPVGAGVLTGTEVFFTHDGDHECVVTLEPGGSISGTIVDALDPQARVAATVSLFRRRDSARFDVQSIVQSMAEPGTFRFDNLAPGVYDLVAANHEGLVGVAGVTLGSGEPRSGVVIAVERAATLEFIAPAHLHVFRSEDRCLFDVRRGDVRLGLTGADPHGRAHLNVPPGRVTVELRVGEELRTIREADAPAGVVTRVRF